MAFPLACKEKQWLMKNHTYLSFITASAALVGVSPRVCNCHDSTEVTHMDLVWVWSFKQPFSQELGCSMSNLAISFHFSKAKATITKRKRKTNFWVHWQLVNKWNKYLYWKAGGKLSINFPLTPQNKTVKTVICNCWWAFLQQVSDSHSTTAQQNEMYN